MAQSFKQWLLREAKDIFGFEYQNGESKTKDLSGNDTKPLYRIKVNEVMEAISRQNLGVKTPYNKFHNTVQWGETSGAIYMEISPLGSFKSIIRRLTIDGEGRPIWVCKQVVPFNDYLAADKPFDESLAGLVFEKIQAADQSQPESPVKDYKDLRKLTVKLAEICRLNQPEIFVYRGIKELAQNEHYIIYFEVRGHGVEAPGSTRVEQFHIETHYDQKRGMIRIWGHDVASPIAQHTWQSQPSEFDEVFLPNQPVAEICECISAALSTY